MEMINLKETFITVQGEGPNTGVPSLFIRFGKCNFKCVWCDTDFDNGSNLSESELHDVINNILKHRPLIKHIVFTGGEPSIWSKWLASWFELYGEIFQGYTVEIETNGYLGFPWRFLSRYFEKVFISCSPKFFEKEYKIMHDEVSSIDWAQVIYKLIVESDRMVMELFVFIRQVFDKDLDVSKVYLQPLDNNLCLARRLVEKNCYGARLCLQQHKIMGIK